MIRNLQRRGARRREPEVVLEGMRVVEEALGADGVDMHGVVVAPGLSATARGKALAAALTALDCPREEVSDRELADMADTESPQGVLVVATPKAWTLEDLKPDPRTPVLILDGIQDPGNVGALIRTAHALGAAGVVTLAGSAALNHPKTVRASAGAIFHLPVLRSGPDPVDTWLTETHTRLVAMASGAEPIRGPMDGPQAIVVGNEGAGVSRRWMDRADLVASVPMVHGAESLNVAVAAGIALYEVIHAG